MFENWGLRANLAHFILIDDPQLSSRSRQGKVRSLLTNGSELCVSSDQLSGVNLVNSAAAAAAAQPAYKSWKAQQPIQW